LCLLLGESINTKIKAINLALTVDMKKAAGVVVNEMR
jgi:hypothetical protein